MTFQFGGIDILFLFSAYTGVLLLLRKIVIFFYKKVPASSNKTENNIDYQIANINIRIFSFNTFTFFMMVFGAMGFTLYRYNDKGIIYSVTGGIISGVVSVCFIVLFLNVFTQSYLNINKKDS